MPFHLSRPQDVCFTFSDPNDPRFQAVVVPQGDLLTIGFRRGVFVDAVLSSELGLGQCGQVVLQHLSLDFVGVLTKQRDLVKSLSDKPTKNGVDGHLSSGRFGERRCWIPRCRS